MVKALRRYGFESRFASAEMSRLSSSPPSLIASGEYRLDSTLEHYLVEMEVAGSTPARPSGRVAQSLVRSPLVAARAVLIVEHVFGRMPAGLHAPKRSRVRSPPALRRSSSVVEHSAPSRHSLVARRARHAFAAIAAPISERASGRMPVGLHAYGAEGRRFESGHSDSSGCSSADRASLVPPSPRRPPGCSALFRAGECR